MKNKTQHLKYRLKLKQLVIIFHNPKLELKGNRKLEFDFVEMTNLEGLTADVEWNLVFQKDREH